VDSSGNSYITGEFFTKAVFGTITLTSAGGQNMFVAKLDANGNFLWAKNAGGTSISVGTSVAVHNSKNIYITGFFIGTVIFGTTTLTSAVGQNVFVAKLDANGNFLWAKSAGGTSGNISRGITVDSGDNTYITGFFFGTAIFGTTTLISAGYDDVFVAKLDANGNFLWATRAGGTKPDQSLSVAVDNSGNSYITGSFQSEAVFSTTTLISAGDAEVFVAKLDSNGNFLWAIRAGGMISKIGSSIAVDNGGNNYITGYFKYNAVFGTTTLKSAGDVDVFVAKLNTNGNFLWARRAGGTYQDRGHGATVDSVGNHYITGHFYSPAVFGTTTLTSGGGITVFVSKNLP
jgi:hypothetical protein